MEFQEALDKAIQILEEELRAPTVKYRLRVRTDADSFVQTLAELTAEMNLQTMRYARPREVVEDPEKFVFGSLNYNLLCALLGQIAEGQRPSFIQSVSLRVVSGAACALTKMQTAPAQPSWNLLVSNLPLVVEFSVRNGGGEFFFRCLGEANPIPGHVILLRHIEDLIALNYSVFSESGYEQVAFCISNFSRIAKTQLEDYGKRKIVDVRFPDGVGMVNVQTECREIIESCEGILEECRKARYLYLKKALSEGLNLEVNQDRETVVSHLQQLGFSTLLISSLNEADRLYLQRATAFDFKSSIGHLRSFLENLQQEAVAAAQEKSKDASTAGWGSGLAYFRKQGVLSEAEEKFAAALYTLLSDEAVHPLIAEREFARLARNMVIEYGLLFLRKLEKLGMKLVKTSSAPN